MNGRFENYIKIISKYINIDEYEINEVGIYKNMRESKIKVKCLKCGYEKIYSAEGFKISKQRGKKCIKCRGKEISMSNECFKNIVQEVTNGEYDVLDKYVNSRTKIKLIHLTCGNEFYVTPHGFLSHGKNRTSGIRCPMCSGNKYKYAKGKKRFIECIEANKDYALINEYNGYNTKILIKHIVCGNEYYITPANFIAGKRCPNCISSKGEFAISKILIKNNIHYIRQKTFDDLILLKKLRFDFYLPEYNCVIEYDGQHHFHPIKFSNSISNSCAVEQFEKTIAKDIIKNQYCIDNNIKLFRITYLDFDNIETILNDIVSTLQRCKEVL